MGAEYFSNYQRICYICSSPIEESMGFVRSADMLRFMEGLQNYIRESCSLCVERVEALTNGRMLNSEQELDIIAWRIREELNLFRFRNI